VNQKPTPAATFSATPVSNYARATSIWSEIAPKRNKDGTTSLITISPGIGGLDLLVATRSNRRALVLNDAQHEYVFLDALPAN
jgi:hypothetical protein